MNLRIEGNHIRFKICKDELQRLNQGEALKQFTSLDGHKLFELNIVTKLLADAALVLDAEPARWTLYINSQTVDELIASKPNRKGLSVSQGSLNLTLQVDIRVHTSKSD